MAERPIELAKNGAHALLEDLEAALASGAIDESDWYRRVAEVITPAYLAATNPRAQSGHSGDEARWERARSLIADAIDRDGTFLDVGCASGLLMESIKSWTRHAVEPYGLDIAPELVALAQHRLPQWAARIWCGNAISWDAPMRFDYVRTGLEYVPRRRRREFVERLLAHVVRPDGRLIIGTVNEESSAARVAPWEEETVAGWGYKIAGHSERPHYSDPRLLYRVFWIDGPERR